MKAVEGDLIEINGKRFKVEKGIPVQVTEGPNGGAILSAGSAQDYSATYYVAVQKSDLPKHGHKVAFSTNCGIVWLHEDEILETDIKLASNV